MEKLYCGKAALNLLLSVRITSMGRERECRTSFPNCCRGAGSYDYGGSAEYFGYSWKAPSIEAKPAPIGSPARRCPGMKKTEACIGYTGKVTLKEGIRNTFDWYKKYVFDGNEVSTR